MKYFGFFISFLVLYCETANSEKIECEAPALTMDDRIKALLDRSLYWTMKYFDSYGPTELDWHPQGHVESDKVVRSYFQIINNRNKEFVLRGYTRMRKTENSPQYVTGNDGFLTVNHGIMDDTYSIFKYMRTFSTGMITKEGIDSYSLGNLGVSSPIGMDVTYALIYISSDGGMIIYQSCDKKLTWVQVADSMLEELFEKRLRKDASFDFVYRQFESDIQNTLNQRGINTGSIAVDLIRSLGFDTFFEDFYMVKKIGNYLSEHFQL